MEASNTKPALVLGLPGGKFDRDDRAVLPQALEAVVDALLFVEHVHDEVTEVDQDPPALSTPLTPQGLVSRFDQLVFDLAGYCDDVALRATGDQKEDVGKRQRIRHVEGDKIFPRFRVGGYGSHIEELESVGRSGHRVNLGVVIERIGWAD
jgi:hypothetical protein